MLIIENVSFYFTEDGEYAPKENLPFVKREDVVAIIKYEKKYLFLYWNKLNYMSLVTGGVDLDENKEDALLREVLEETGYFDIKSVTKVDCINVSRFYVAHKNQNREAIYYPYLVELNSLNKKDIDELEKQEHTCIWIDEKEINNLNLFENHRKMLEKALEV